MPVSRKGVLKCTCSLVPALRQPAVQVVLTNQDSCKEFAECFMAYEALWTQDMDSTLAQWLESNSTTNEGAPA